MALALATAGGVWVAPVADAAAATSQVSAAQTGFGQSQALSSLGYPNFTTFEASGRGDKVVRLPAARSAAIVTATHKGSGSFRITGLDASNERTESVIRERGEFVGTGAFGLDQYSSQAATRSLQIEADGDWTIKVASVNTAPALPRSGSGAGVFRWMNPATVWTLTHNGSSNFIVEQYVRDRREWSSRNIDWNLLVNKIGQYSGSIAVQGGPSIVVIDADGDWRIAR